MKSKRTSDNIITALIFVWGLALAVYWVHTCTENSKPARPYQPIKTQVVLANSAPLAPTAVSVGEMLAESIEEACGASSEATEAQTEASRFTDYDRDLLMRIASAEAGDQGVEGMALVMLVVINRALINGASIEAVIYAEGQFGAIHDVYWLNNYHATGCDEAMALVESGWDASNGALYFCTPSHNGWHRRALEYLFTYKGHEFYR